MEQSLDNPELTDEQLAAEAAREGSDGPAFVTLLGRYQDRVWRICYRLLSNAEDSHDAAQEVFVRLFMSRTKFEGRSKYSTWVHAVTVRTCLSFRRGRGRRQRHEATAQQHEAERQLRGDPGERPEATLDLMQMLDVLEEDERALLILKYSEGHSHEELAEMFDLSVSACKMRISRACDKLRQRFPNERFDENE